MKRTPLNEFECSIARTLDVVGEWWTLLIVRDIFMGLRRFEEIRPDLGISRNVLTDRLATLVEHGILVKVPVERGFEEYRLTDKGIDLHPVLVSLMNWGDKWESPNGAPLVLIHDCGHKTVPHLTCPHCDGEVEARSVTPKAGPGLSKRNKSRAK